MMLALKIVALQLVSLLAPVVCLFYRKGIFLTPDDQTSPYGMYEPRMRYIYAHLPQWVGDWYWLGIRNSGYGLAYKWKPDHFKNLTSYDDCVCFSTTQNTWYGKRRTVEVDGFREQCFSIGIGRFGFHVICGYRLRPVFDEWYANRFLAAGIPYRKVNMDARPILSIRAGMKDD